MPPKTTPAVSVPSYAQLLSSSSSKRATKTKTVTTEKKKKKNLTSEGTSPSVEKTKKNTSKTSSTSSVSPVEDVPPSQSIPKEDVVVDCRVVLASSGLFGTVRYVGEASFQSGIWVGIELDSEQGKNDGVVKGHRYFSCPQNHGIFVRPTSFEIISYPSVTSQPNQTTVAAPSSPTITTVPPPLPIADTVSPSTVDTAPPPPAAAAAQPTVTGAYSNPMASLHDSNPSRPGTKSSASSEDGDNAASGGSYVTHSNPVTSAPSSLSSSSSYASFVSKTTQHSNTGGRKSGTASPVGGVSSSSSPRRSSNDLYGNHLIGSDSDRTSPARSSTSASRPSYDGTTQGRRLSPRRRTAALVSSIDDVLASMEYAASDINRKSDNPKTLKKKKSSNNLTNRPKSPFDNRYQGGSQSRPKSPFDRNYASSVYSSEEERMFVENLVELVAKAPVMSEYLKTEIEKHKPTQDLTDLQQRINKLETAQPTNSSHQGMDQGQSERVDQSIEALSLRIAKLEQSVATPVKALTHQLEDLELAISRLQTPSGGGGGGDGAAEMAQVATTLVSVKALALQAFHALEVSH